MRPSNLIKPMCCLCQLQLLVEIHQKQSYTGDKVVVFTKTNLTLQRLDEITWTDAVFIYCSLSFYVIADTDTVLKQSACVIVISSSLCGWGLAFENTT